MGAPTKYPPPDFFDHVMTALSGPLGLLATLVVGFSAATLMGVLLLLFVAGGCC